MQPASFTTPPARRRRRRPDEAEAEILNAADELLRERPAARVTVAAIMERTTLSRKSFYVYFRDRHQLITRLVAPLRARLDDLTARTIEEISSGQGRDAFLAIARMYANDGPLLQALAEASREDPEAARIWREFTEPPIAAIASRIRQEIELGRIPPMHDVERATRALVAMNLATFFDSLVGRPHVDPEPIVETLSELWQRALYGRVRGRASDPEAKGDPSLP